jgi:hypothetical protein
VASFGVELSPAAPGGGGSKEGVWKVGCLSVEVMTGKMSSDECTEHGFNSGCGGRGEMRE